MKRKIVGFILTAAAVAVAVAAVLADPSDRDPRNEEPSDFGHGAGDADGAQSPPPSSLVAAFNAVVDDAGRGGEPMLGVAPKGDLFTYQDPPGDQLGRSAVYRSQDGGRSWQATGPPVAPTRDLDPGMVVDADGTIWYDTLSDGCNTVAVSQDLGESWFAHPAVCAGPSTDRPRIVPTEGGTAFLFHRQINTYSVLKTTDHGQTWAPLAAIDWRAHDAGRAGSGWSGGGFWNAATGSVFLTMAIDEGPISPLLGDITRGPGFAVTRDGGDTFTLGRAPGVEWRQGTDEDGGIGGDLVDGAADAEGNVYLTWAEKVGDNIEIRLAVSQDDGRTWTQPIVVDTGENSKVFPTIAAGAPGRVAVAYYATDAPGLPGEAPADAVWNVTVAWTDSALDPAPAFQRGTLSLAPVKKGAICVEGIYCGGGSGEGRELLDFFDIQPLPEGRVGAVWTSTVAVPGEIVNVFGTTKAPILS